MFLRSREPVPLAEGRIDGLRASLNRPVVDIEDLPAGPARAAIALYRDASGDRGLSVAVRSERSGAVILFGFRGELNSEVSQAMDAGLQFAEGMGFLFDEDMLSRNLPAAERKALEAWCHVAGDPLPAQRPVSARPALAGAAPDDEVLLVNELTAGVGEVLSKFRRPAQVPPLGASTGETLGVAPARFGRIPIVQRRRADGLPRGASVPDLLARLLARF